LGVEIVASLPCEGTRLDRCLRGDMFDRVLVDAPCSNTGVLRRRVDLRWRIDTAEMKQLVQLQRRLLESALQFVRPGGILVYSTCSIEPEENEQVIESFQKSHPQLNIETVRTLFPPRDNMDGTFCARIVVRERN
jgi:16S rRNA (cytosine967-C5)-methyltransferase